MRSTLKNNSVSSATKQGFWYFARSRTREIPKKKREIPRNPPEIFPNTCRQNIFNTYLGYQTCFIHSKRPNLSWNFVTATSKQRSKTNRRSWINVVKNWALATMWNALPLVDFSEICQKKTSEVGCFLLIVSRRSFLPKFPVKSADISANFDFFPAKLPIFPRICPWKSREILIFFPRNIRSPDKTTWNYHICVFDDNVNAQ